MVHCVVNQTTTTTLSSQTFCCIFSVNGVLMNEFFRDNIGGRIELHCSRRRRTVNVEVSLHTSKTACGRAAHNNDDDDDDDDGITSNLPIASPGNTVSRQACHTNIFGSSSVGRWTNASYLAIQAERRAHFPTTSSDNNAKLSAPTH